ncbi:MAG: BamA/TamA family outer membrane protein [Armatimonadota bacterium]|nr:BamA/TamA family outer membrane protein [Armatimonadota bacterium]MDR7437531.1 BamA/TamA family outer membrane protein [Armatimonadota bacterium]MDR7507790.1 BamA/TamA family outer membrane protein [Armatimonadota bacterium]MDR7581822.1 BamA/TamA family outer membrane protein [Armatimonadota bacterium]
MVRSLIRRAWWVALAGLVVQPAPALSQAPSPPQTVKAIEVRGAVRVPIDHILAAVTETRVGEPLSDEKVRADVRAINDLGWFTDVMARLEPAPDGVTVVFLVTENPVLAEVVVEGNASIPTRDILEALALPTGEVLNLRRLRDGTAAVQRLYESRGYVLARVADVAILPADSPDQARLRLRVAEGVVEAVRFDGLRKTQLATARRYVRETTPGVVFNVNVLQRDLQRLFDSGLFESVRARPEPGQTPDSAVIVIEVREARTAQAAFGLGYNNREGLLGFIEYRDRNWRGRGQSVALRVERAVQTGSDQVLNYELSFSEPFLEGPGASLDLSLFSRASVEQEYDSSGTVQSRYSLQRQGAFIALSRFLDGTTTGTLRLRSELAEITLLPLNPADPSSPVSPPPSGFVPGRVVGLQLSATRDVRDSRLAPTRGSRLFASGELAAAALGSDFAFTKYTVDYQHLLPVGHQSTLVGRILVGAATGTLPLQERFVFGGPSTVRGLPLGFRRENSLVVANVEYRFPLSALIPAFQDVSGILFFDAGNAPLQFTSPLTSYGVGVAIATPLGPIRIDMAWAPDGTRQTWLSLGAPF